MKFRMTRRRATVLLAFMALLLSIPVSATASYAASDGWGFAEFKDGKAAGLAVHQTCLPCHELAKAQDFVFTHYAH